MEAVLAISAVVRGGATPNNKGNATDERTRRVRLELCVQSRSEPTAAYPQCWDATHRSANLGFDVGDCCVSGVGKLHDLCGQRARPRRSDRGGGDDGYDVHSRCDKARNL
jgi:hypothetical protein